MSGSLLDRISEVCAGQADRVVSVHGDAETTFGALASQSMVLAAAFEERSAIGLCLGRGPAAHASYLGVIAAGCTAVPLSPRMPPQRLVSMCQRAGVRRLLAEKRVLSGSAWATITNAGIAVSEVPEHDDAAGTTEFAPNASVNPDDTAYILFTSGSTGAPKGVEIPHRALWAYMKHAVHEAELRPGSRMSANFDLTFDPSLFDILGPLISGATVVFPTVPEQRSPVRYAVRHELTHWFSVPSLISFAAQAGMLRPGCLPGLERSAFIGEPLTVAQATAWAQAAPNSKIVNVYGPTEVTVACTSHQVAGAPEGWPGRFPATIPIGVPYPGLEACMVDDGRVVEDSGELCVRGVQRLTSYLDRSDNRDRFYRIDDGVASGHNEDGEPDSTFWYRTGDRVTTVPEGYVHLGRIDRQVKVHGYRIELGEIEHELQGVDGVLEAAAVLVRDRIGNEIAVCYLAADAQNPIPPELAREHLAKRLPDYAMPFRVELVDSIPRNDRGKTDYAALTDRFAAA